MSYVYDEALIHEAPHYRSVDPTVAEVEAAIRTLDGDFITTVTLEATHSTTSDIIRLTVFGGDGGVGVVFMEETAAGIVEKWLVNGPSVGSTVPIVHEGMDVEISTHRKVSVEDAVTASRDFINLQTFSASLTWENGP